jgi:Flp pilus assembly protein TadB
MANVLNNLGNLKYVVIILMCVLLFLLYELYTRQRRTERADRTIKRSKKNSKNYLYHVYVIFTTIPGLKRYFTKIRNRLASVYPADDISINLRATKMLLLALVASAFVIVLSIMAAGGDIFFIIAGITITYLMFITVIDTSLEHVDIKLMAQLQGFIDQIREQYNRLGRVDDAVSYVLDTLPYEISLHATKIHEVLTATHIDKAVNEYIDVAPNKYIMTFAAISATTMEYGDKKLANGESLFLKNLNFLKEEVNIELLRQKKNNALFSGLTYVTLIPIVAVKPIEHWAMSNMPEISEFYKGSYGIIAMAFVFLFSAISYTVVRALKNGHDDKDQKDTDLFKTISEMPVLQRFLNGQVNRNYSKALRVNDMLRLTGDRLGINTFLVKRYFIGILGAFAMGLILTTSVIRDKATQLHDFSQAFDSSIVVDKDYRETMQAVAEDYTNTMAEMDTDGSEQLNEDDLKKEIMKNTKVKKENEADMVAKVIIQRVQKSRNTYFKWYYMLAIFGSGFVGYMVPLWILMFKQRTAKMSMEDEVSQFQTLALILMHVDGVNTVMLLEWMERFAFCFKDSISTCIIDLPHQGQKAIQAMADKESFQPFQSLCLNLLAIDNVGVEKAFSNVETDREYYKEKRKEDNEIIMNRKLQIGKFVALFPVVFVFGAYMIYPLLKLATSMMGEINSAV